MFPCFVPFAIEPQTTSGLYVINVLPSAGASSSFLYRYRGFCLGFGSSSTLQSAGTTAHVLAAEHISGEK